ncbi:MAG: SpaA isopeptide-forming pilin-related protein [Lachnospiraceae bacterium]
MGGKLLKETIAVLLSVLVFFSFLGFCGMDAKAATYKLTYKKLSSYKLIHNKWNSKAKFGSGSGTTTIKNNVTAKLHYVNGEYAYCIYMPDSTDDGESKLYNPDNDSRTEWVNKKTGGYPRYAYCAAVEFYLVDKKISLNGISGSSKLLALSKNERMLLSQAFVWYMEYAGWSRKEGTYAMAIDNISGWSAAKQYVLFDELYTAAKEVLSKLKVSNQCYKLKIDGNSHQPVMVLNCEELPQYEKVTYSGAGEDSEKVTLNIIKKDSSTDKGLAGAEFSFACDGEDIGIEVTDSEGKISYLYRRMLKTNTYSAVKSYVTNWKNLSAQYREIVTKNGYYQDKTKALQAARTEVNAKISAELLNLKSKTHEWVVTEIKAPFGHSNSSESPVTIVEGDEKTLEYTFYNPEEEREVHLEKTSSVIDYGVDATLKDAVYFLYAKEDIFSSDNQTVIYKKDSLVTTIRTDKEGKASVSNLYPGKYYIKEIEAPKGFLLSDEEILIDLSNDDQYIKIEEEPIVGRIKIIKTYSGDKLPEENAEFELYNSKGVLVDTIVTDISGVGESKELPYGTYRIHQVKGIKGYTFMADQNIVIDGSQEIYTIEENDDLLYAGIAILKTTSIEDDETETYEKKPEYQAEFEIRTKEGTLVETIVTDEKGVAKSSNLDPGTYIIHQTKGSDNFAFTEDFEVTFADNEKVVKSFELSNESTARKVRIKKTKSRNGECVPEQNAEFVVLDESLAESIKSEDLSTQEKRTDYVNSLDEKAVITRIVTDKNGEGVTLLDEFPEEKDFIVLQISGEKGYTLAEPYFSRENSPEREGLFSVYTFSADDMLDDWAKIKIKKKLVVERYSNQISTRAEDGARFEIRDSKGNFVEELITESDGEITSGELDYGVYFLHQMDGKETHEFIKDQRIVLSEENKHQTIEYEFTDDEKNVTFRLVKRSAVTEKLLDNAVYEIYNEDGNKVATIITGLKGEEGVATCTLPYGKYTIKEIVAPDGFKPSEKKEFILSFETVDYKDDAGIYQYNDWDEPVYGEIAITKTGDVLTDFYDNNFQYESSTVSGAEYALYARKDIILDDGSILWKSGDLIDTKETDENGIAQFTRKSNNGTETKKFPIGEYYIKELKAPYGYVLDETEHEIVLTWDSKAQDLNIETDEKEDSENSGEEEETLEEVYPKESKEQYMIGSSDCSMLNLWLYVEDATVFCDWIFTWEEAPDDVETVDVSSMEDGSVVMWWDEEKGCVYISTQTPGQNVIFNADSGGMFGEAYWLKNISFEHIDTSAVISMQEMFYGCKNLTELDLSNFNTDNVWFTENMFYGCTKLENVYAPDNILAEWGVKKVTSVSAMPKYEILAGTKYEPDDFTFYLNYNDNSSEEVTFSSEEIEIKPEIASVSGEQEIEIFFDSNSGYEEFSPVKVKCQVVELPDVKQDEVKDIQYGLELTDELKTYVIRLKKIDTDQNPVEGAEFTLYAATTIVNAKGEVLFKKGDEIATAVSEIQDGDEAIVSFSGLPSNLYKENSHEAGTMFTVKETKPPLGFKSEGNEIIDFDADLKESVNASVFVHEYTDDSGKAGSIVVEENTAYIYDSAIIENEAEEYVVIHKNWQDYENAAAIRPVSITVTVILPDDTKKEYILSQENEWTVTTDIPKSIAKQCKFEEETIAGYSGSGNLNSETGVYEFTNIPEKVYKNIPVVKVWDDKNNRDAIRPESITVQLYRDDLLYKEVKLSEANDWKYTWSQLDVENPDTKEEYIYEVKEAEFDKLTGDATTGYRVRYEEVEPSDVNEYEYTTTVITNIHEPSKGSIKIRKKDEDNNPLKGVEFTLFDKDDHEVQRLKSDENGELLFENLDIGEYTIQETKTVEGNSLLSEPIKVAIPYVITEKEANDQNADVSKAVKVDGKYYFYNLTFDVTNEAALSLPKTGGAQKYCWLILGILLMAGGVVIWHQD